MDTDGHEISEYVVETETLKIHSSAYLIHERISTSTCPTHVQLNMAITLADLPKEVLEQVIAPSYDGQRSQWRTNLLCLKIFHDIALYFQYRSLVMTPVNIACFPLLPQAPPDQHHCAPFHSALRGDEDDMCLRSSHHVQRPSFDDLAGQPPVQTGSLPMIAHSIRHLTLELPGFACAARLRRFCAAPYTHITVDKTKLYVRHADFVAHLNHCLCSLAAQLPKLKMLKSFSIKAYRGRPYYSCTEDRPFLAETTIIRLLRGLRECKELRALDIDLTDAEEIVGSMALEERSCADHSCFVISQTVASLPKLRSISLRKREMCAGCLDFLTVESPPNDADPHDVSLLPRPRLEVAHLASESPIRKTV